MVPAGVTVTYQPSGWSSLSPGDSTDCPLGDHFGTNPEPDSGLYDFQGGPTPVYLNHNTAVGTNSTLLSGATIQFKLNFSLLNTLMVSGSYGTQQAFAPFAAGINCGKEGYDSSGADAFGITNMWSFSWPVVREIVRAEVQPRHRVVPHGRLPTAGRRSVLGVALDSRR